MKPQVPRVSRNTNVKIRLQLQNKIVQASSRL